MTGRSPAPPAPAATSEFRASGRVVPCPACRRPALFDIALNPWRPFCSQRCREGDLGAWANEDYRVEAAPPQDDPDLPLPPA